jgi:hypothetical protein
MHVILMVRACWCAASLPLLFPTCNYSFLLFPPLNSITVTHTFLPKLNNPYLPRVQFITPTMADSGIDRKMEERMEFSTSKEVVVAPTFEAMHLKENLLRGIYAYGYESPSAVQSRAIVQICKGRDTIAQAQSGTGKTATFSISILQVIDTAVRETQGMLHLFIRLLNDCLLQLQLSSCHQLANSQLKSNPSSWPSAIT